MRWRSCIRIVCGDDELVLNGHWWFARSSTVCVAQRSSFIVLSFFDIGWIVLPLCLWVFFSLAIFFDEFFALFDRINNMNSLASIEPNRLENPQVSWLSFFITKMAYGHLQSASWILVAIKLHRNRSLIRVTEFDLFLDGCLLVDLSCSFHYRLLGTIITQLFGLWRYENFRRCNICFLKLFKKFEYLLELQQLLLHAQIRLLFILNIWRYSAMKLQRHEFENTVFHLFMFHVVFDILE